MLIISKFPTSIASHTKRSHGPHAALGLIVSDPWTKVENAQPFFFNVAFFRDIFAAAASLNRDPWRS